MVGVFLIGEVIENGSRWPLFCGNRFRHADNKRNNFNTNVRVAGSRK
jgi:hypothetical protein